MGYEYRVRFEVDERLRPALQPDAFLATLTQDIPSLDWKKSDPSLGPPEGYEYWRREHPNEWPARVHVEPDGFYICEYDHALGKILLGHLVMFALRHAKDRVIVEDV